MDYYVFLYWPTYNTSEIDQDGWIQEPFGLLTSFTYIGLSLLRKMAPFPIQNKEITRCYNLAIVMGVFSAIYHVQISYIAQVCKLSTLTTMILWYMHAAKIHLSHREEFFMVSAWLFLLVNPSLMVILIFYFLVKFTAFDLRIRSKIQRRSLQILCWVIRILVFLALFSTYLDIKWKYEPAHPIFHLCIAMLTLTTGIAIELAFKDGIIK